MGVGLYRKTEGSSEPKVCELYHGASRINEEVLRFQVTVEYAARVKIDE